MKNKRKELIILLVLMGICISLMIYPCIYLTVHHHDKQIIKSQYSYLVEDYGYEVEIINLQKVGKSKVGGKNYRVYTYDVVLKLNGIVETVQFNQIYDFSIKMI